MSGSRSGFLYADSSFIEGLARILDLGNTLTFYNESLTEQQADRLALRNDWRAIGSDLADVIRADAQERYQQLTLALGRELQPA